jgi:DNA polymerase
VGDAGAVDRGDDDIQTALALLARGLAGAIEVSGLEHLPRPTFTMPTAAPAPPVAATPPVPPPAPAPTIMAPAPAPTTPPPPPAPSRPAVPATTTTPAAAGADTASMPLVGEPLRVLVDGIVARPLTAGARLKLLEDDAVGACTRCKLHRGRNRLVFGVGNPEADLVFVGEGPGEDEDRQGIPFVGRAGQLLTKMIGAMGRDRDRDVYICNVVKCRPPNNRKPEPDEVDACIGFLDAQLAIVRPKVLVGLGGTACHTLLQTTTPISKLRGTWKSYKGIPFMPTYHPSYLLREERDPQQTRKREAWSDLKLVMQKLKEG